MPRKRYSVKDALTVLGLPTTLDMRNEDQYKKAHAVWLELTVVARRNGDDTKAATLSEASAKIKQRFNTRHRKCGICGKICIGNYCGMHARTVRHYSSNVEPMNNTELYKIETVEMVPNVRTSQLNRTMEQLAKGYVGDSFITDKCPTTIHMAARIIGGSGKIIARIINPEEKDKNKLRWRVWRTDGMSYWDVNEVIRKRREGTDRTKPAPWPPLGEAEKEALKNKKYQKASKQPLKEEAEASK
jgi:hypothetical protein